MKSDLKNVKEIKEILKNCSPDARIRVYYVDKEGQGETMNKPKKGKITLALLAEKMDAGFRQINTRLDNLEIRVDRIEKRLDYNNLKKLPN